MKKSKIKVLYFQAGIVATDEERAAIEEFSNRHLVCVRNAAMVNPNDGLEDFHIVAGTVPPKYAKEAASRPPVEEMPAPVAPVASVIEGSPVAPPAAPEPEQAEASAKPKAPAAKPEAAKGWKPNA